ncbi:cupin domain-containing protein [Rhodopirellula europaea]|uniref:cupin domain-containing protein n=1 Tax=Rhodopirellula europaea TaxID=1263866 RepID=UPI003D27A3F7|tara:strand:- start:9967 stop:11151 length:1185 start_codon:yes stop_codon:yes gene_type:complete
MKTSPLITLSLYVLLIAFNSTSHGQDTESGAAKTPRHPVAEQPSHSKMPVVKLLRTDPISSKVDGALMSKSLIELSFAPGASSPPHHHPGEVVGYVLKGTLEFKIEGKPLRVLHQGDTFFEPTMVLHEVARNPDTTKETQVVVTMVHPRNARRLTIPAEEVAKAKTNSKAAAITASPQTCTINVNDSVNRATFDKSLPTIGVLLFDNVLMTEVTAPIDVFSKPNEEGKRLFNVVTVAQSHHPVPMESGLRVVPDYSFDDCPDLNVLVVSSSYDMEMVVATDAIVEFVKTKGKTTDFTMSNCAGAHLIGASGVAKGRKIVTYIGGGDLLQQTYPSLSVQDDRQVSFVKDGKMISSNGNLASYISALELLEEMTDSAHRNFVESHLYLERLQNYER